MVRKIFAALVSFCLVFEQVGFAQVAPQVPVPGYLSGMLSADRFRPVHLRALSFDGSGRDLKVIIEKGSAGDLSSSEISDSASVLLEFFKIGLVLPNSMFWVNLRPDDPVNIIDPNLEKTDLGRIFLESDLQLKKDISAMTSPDTAEGRAYWNKLYQKAEKLFGQEDITVPTMTRPWIVPAEIIMAQSPNGAYVYKATLKVMLEQDYIKDAPGYGMEDKRLKELNEYSSALIREFVLPRLTVAVNSSKKYAQLRQVYYSLILAQWFKRNFGASSSVSRTSPFSAFMDKMDLTGLESSKKWSRDAYYDAYKRSFEKGEYNREETVPSSGGLTVRRYFSGGINVGFESAGVSGALIDSPEVKAVGANIGIRVDPDTMTVNGPAVKKDGGSNPGLDVAVRELADTGVKIAFGTSGWRGKWVEIDGKKPDFTAENIRRAAQGVAEYYKDKIRTGSVLIGFDPRGLNPEWAKEIASILSANGIKVKLAASEPTPTPVLAYLAGSRDDITAVINLTASHNKGADDGFKFSPYHGGAADKEATDLISSYANSASNYRFADYGQALKAGFIEELALETIVNAYVREYLVPTLKSSGAWDPIVAYIRNNRDFRVIADPMQGTSVKYQEALFGALSEAAGRVFYTMIHTDNRDNKFSQVGGAPNPTEEPNNKFLREAVRNTPGSIGLATDGDADRFGIFDLGDKEISSNEFMAMAAYFLAKKHQGALKDYYIGKTVATSNFVNAVAKYTGVRLFESAVGFKYFVEKAVKENIKFLVAGEESAHVGVGPFMRSWDDGIAMNMMAMWMMSETGVSLTDYKRGIEKEIGKKFFYNRKSVDLTPELKAKAAALVAEAKSELAKGVDLNDMTIAGLLRSIGMESGIKEVITVDGVKVVFDNGDWFLIRLSGTEDVARLYTEVAADYNDDDQISKARQEKLIFAGKDLLGVKDGGDSEFAWDDEAVESPLGTSLETIDPSFEALYAKWRTLRSGENLMLSPSLLQVLSDKMHSENPFEWVLANKMYSKLDGVQRELIDEDFGYRKDGGEMSVQQAVDNLRSAMARTDIAGFSARINALDPMVRGSSWDIRSAMIQAAAPYLEDRLVFRTYEQLLRDAKGNIEPVRVEALKVYGTVKDPYLVNEAVDFLTNTIEPSSQAFNDEVRAQLSVLKNTLNSKDGGRDTQARRAADPVFDRIQFYYKNASDRNTRVKLTLMEQSVLAARMELAADTETKTLLSIYDLLDDSEYSAVTGMVFEKIFNKYSRLQEGRNLELSGPELYVLGNKFFGQDIGIDDLNKAAKIFSRLGSDQREKMYDVSGLSLDPRYRYLKDIDFKGKRVVERVDFNTPAKVKFNEDKGTYSIDISDPTRIRESMADILVILAQDPKYLVLTMHFEPKISKEVPDSTGKMVKKSVKTNMSTRDLATAFRKMLPAEYRDRVVFLEDSVNKDGIAPSAMDKIKEMTGGRIIVLENIRYASGEKKNDDNLREQLESLADEAGVNAWGAAHRAHASMMLAVGNRFMGMLIEKEVRMWSRLLDPDRKSIVAVFGGLKVEDKVDLINKYLGFLREGDVIEIGGAMAFPFLLALDPALDLGNSVVERDKVDLARTIMESAEAKGIKILLPVDHRITTKLEAGAPKEATEGLAVRTGWMAVDTGPKTDKLFAEAVREIVGRQHGIFVWNGPVGVFEPHLGGFNDGTFSLARSAEEVSAYGDTYLGGGETVLAVKSSKVRTNKMKVSTGGGVNTDYLGAKGELETLVNLRYPDTDVSRDGGSIAEYNDGSIVKANVARFLANPVWMEMARMGDNTVIAGAVRESGEIVSIMDEDNETVGWNTYKNLDWFDTFIYYNGETFFRPGFRFAGRESAIKAIIQQTFDGIEHDNADSVSAKPQAVGGIDMRALPLPVYIAKGLPAKSFETVSASELDARWRSIQDDIAKGVVPYENLKIYASFCGGNSGSSDRLEAVASYVAGILAMEEEAGVQTTAQLKEILACIG